MTTLFVVLVIALPTVSSLLVGSSLDPLTSKSRRPTVCVGVQGNPDLYGLGIRLGIQFQWTASLVSNHFFKREISLTFDVNSIILLALSLVLVQGASQRNLTNVDIITLLKLCFGFVLAALQYYQKPKSHLRTTIRRLIAIGTISLSV